MGIVARYPFCFYDMVIPMSADNQSFMYTLLTCRMDCIRQLFYFISIITIKHRLKTNDQLLTKALIGY
jgi:hypothetical protein